MKTLIIYTSTHGCTERIASDLSRQLSGESQIVNLKQNPYVDFSPFERVILGGSIHGGKIQPQMRNFCERNQEKLIQKELGLFICCMYGGKQAQAELRSAFPERLHQKAKAEAIMGGELNFEKMNLVQRFVVRKISKVNHSVQHLDKLAFKTFAKKMDQPSPGIAQTHQKTR